MDKGNTLLSDKYLEMLVVLRMNRKFMEHMRDHYANELKMLSELPNSRPSKRRLG